MNNDYKHRNRNKFLLRYHLIFVCKYRKPLLTHNNVINDFKRLSAEIAKKHNVEIKYLETDKDHIHYMIETTPSINLSDFVRVLKQYTSYHLWQKYSVYLSKVFWKEKTFWSDGYFIASIGKVSTETLKHYIENQGKD